MVNQQLIDYVNHQLQMGVSRELIKNALFESGWCDSDIAAAMSAISTQGVTASATPSPRPGAAGAVVTSDIFQPKPTTAAPELSASSQKTKVVEAIFQPIQPGAAAQPVRIETARRFEALPKTGRHEISLVENGQKTSG